MSQLAVVIEGGGEQLSQLRDLVQRFEQQRLELRSGYESDREALAQFETYRSNMDRVSADLMMDEFKARFMKHCHDAAGLFHDGLAIMAAGLRQKGVLR
jgi:hypothetical protein